MGFYNIRRGWLPLTFRLLAVACMGVDQSDACSTCSATTSFEASHIPYWYPNPDLIKFSATIDNQFDRVTGGNGFLYGEDIKIPLEEDFSVRAGSDGSLEMYLSMGVPCGVKTVFINGSKIEPGTTLYYDNRPDLSGAGGYSGHMLLVIAGENENGEIGGLYFRQTAHSHMVNGDAYGFSFSVKFSMEEDESGGGPSPSGSYIASLNTNNGGLLATWHPDDLEESTKLASIVFGGLSPLDPVGLPLFWNLESGGHKQRRTAGQGTIDVRQTGSAGSETLTIEFYPEAQSGTTIVNGFYPVSGIPVKQVVISPGQNGTLDYKLSENGTETGYWVLSETSSPESFGVTDMASGQKKVRMVQETSNSRTVSNETWDASVTPNVLLKRRINTSEQDGDVNTTTLETWDMASDPDVLMGRSVRVTETFPWGDALVSLSEGAEGQEATTYYSYYGDGDGVTDTDSWYGKLKSVLQPDDTWTLHQYENLPSDVKSITWGPFENATLPTAVPGTGSGYIKNVIYNNGTREIYTDGYLTSRSRSTTATATGTFFGVTDPSLTSSEEWYGAGTNDKLVSKTYKYASGANAGKALARVEPDGTCTFYQYYTGEFDPANWEFSSGSGTDRMTVVKHGKLNSAGNDVEYTKDSTAETSVEDEDGKTLFTRSDVGLGFTWASAEIYSYAGDNLTSISRYVAGLSAPQSVYSATYDGDELESSTDEFGAVTTSEEEGNVTTTTVDDGTVVTVDVSETDATGRIAAQTNNNLTTQFAYSTTAAGGQKVIVTEPSGATAVSEYWLDGNLHSVASSGRATRYYSESVVSNGMVSSIQSEANGARQTTTQRDMLGRVLTENYPKFGGGSTSVDYSYNALGQLESIAPGGGEMAPQRYTYDSMGQQEISGLDMNEDDQLTETSGGTDRLTKIDRSYGFVYATGENGAPYQISKTLRLLPSGWVIDQEIWSRMDGRRTIVTQGGRTITTTINVDRANQVTTVTELDSDIGTPRITKYASNRTLLEVQEPWQSGTQKTTYDYYSGGQLKKVKDAMGRETTYTYYPDGVQGAGQIATIYLPGGATITRTYTLAGNLEAESGTGTYWKQYAYNEFGELTGLAIKPNGTISWTNWLRDAGTGLISKKSYGNPTSAFVDNNTVVEYDYNQRGWLTERTWARGIDTTYGYTKAGDVNSINYSDSTPDVTGMVYDRAGRLTDVTDAAGTRTITFSDDDQRADESWASGTGVLAGYEVTRSFHISGKRQTLSASGPSGFSYPSATYGYSGGRISSIAQSGLTFSYPSTDGLAQVPHFSVTSNGNTFTQSVGHDAAGNMTYVTSTLNSSPVTSYGTAASPVTFDAAGRRHIIPREDGSNWTYGYNTRSEVTSGQKEFSDATPIPGHRFVYNYDPIGNRYWAKEGGDAEGANLVTTSTGINLLNQYSSVSVPSGNRWITGEASSDANVFVNGKWTWRHGTFFGRDIDLRDGGSAAAWKEITVDAKLPPTSTEPDMLVSSQSGHVLAPPAYVVPSYDDDGNLTNDGLWIYEWDGESRLKAMETVSTLPTSAQRRLEFLYDFEGRRVAKVDYVRTGSSWEDIDTTIFLYDGWNIIAEKNGTISRQYLWGKDMSGTLDGAGGVGGLLAMKDVPTSKTYVYATDLNGNVGALVELETGQISARYEYGPFGEPLRASGSMAKVNPFRFSTKYADNETGLVGFELRPTYDSSIGRFLSRDPINDIGFKALHRRADIGAKGLQIREEENLYRFVDNDPINNVDPLGLKIETREMSQTFRDAIKTSLETVSGGKLCWSKKNDKWELTVIKEGSGKLWNDLNIGIKAFTAFKIIRDPAMGNAWGQVGWWRFLGREVRINENVSGAVALEGGGSYTVGLDVILWHELVGHAIFNHGHPREKWNTWEFRFDSPLPVGWGRSDPAVAIENEARKKLGIPLRRRQYWETEWAWYQ